MSNITNNRLSRILNKQVFFVTQSAATRLRQLLSDYYHHHNHISSNQENSPHQANSIIQCAERGPPKVPSDKDKNSKSPFSCVAIKIGLKRKGCSGLSYEMSFVDSNDISKSDEVIGTEYGDKVVIDSKAIMFLTGTQMDFIEETLGSRFVFNNPNQKSSCGCGKSFTV